MHGLPLPHHPHAVLRLEEQGARLHGVWGSGPGLAGFSQGRVGMRGDQWALGVAEATVCLLQGLSARKGGLFLLTSVELDPHKLSREGQIQAERSRGHVIGYSRLTCFTMSGCLF